MTERHEQVWVSIDAGKAHHWAAGVNATGEKVFSRKVINGEDEILALIVTASETANEVRWAVDISGRASTLLLALLIANGQSVVYVPGVSICGPRWRKVAMATRLGTTEAPRSGPNL